MREYLISAACNGGKPGNVVGAEGHERSRLMKRLISERHVPRFMVAPAGFGKTSLAAAYAEDVFGWDRVWWLSADDPRFIRDLDSGDLTEYAGAVPRAGNLFVFEDVPYLDDERAGAFSGVVDLLVGKGWEVIVTTDPFADSFSQRQHARVVLTAGDFLLDDEELAALPSGVAPSLRRAERIPAVVWGGAAGADAVMKGLHPDEIPVDIQLAVFAMLILQEGTFEEITLFARSLKRETRHRLATALPYVGMDEVAESFASCRFPVRSVLSAFEGRLESMANAAASGKESFVVRLADALVARGRCDRAAELSIAACTRRRRAVWLEERQDDMHSVGGIFAASRVLESFGDHPFGIRPALLVGAAMRAALCEQLDSASRYGARAVLHDSSDFVERALGAYIWIWSKRAARFVSGDQGRISPCEQAEGFFPSVAVPEGLSASDGVIVQLLSACGAHEDARMAEVVMRALGRVAGDRRALFALSLHAHLLVLESGLPAPGGTATDGSRERAFDAMAEILKARDEARLRPDLFEAVIFDAVMTLRRSRPGGSDSADGVISAERAARLDAMLAEFEKQRRLSGGCAAASDRVCVSPDFAGQGFRPPTGDEQECFLAGNRGQAAEACEAEPIPILTVRLFGGMEVWLGDELLDPRAFSKQKAKTLLAVLVLHDGREVPRNRLIDIMWPNLIGDAPMNNFYSMWSVLKRALSLPDGTCPYLVRHQGSCLIDKRYVRSDIEDFEALCRSLQFGDAETGEWTQMHLRMCETYAGDLLPSEMKNQYIVRMRTAYRDRFVDALLSAGNRFLEKGEGEAALWFIREACARDDGREDCYGALMRAQIMTGQRSAAVKSYLLCRRVMKHRYGLGVSPEIDDLYNSIVPSEPQEPGANPE